ncbi:MAG: pyrroline-5-carboxylate reductase [Ignavibacteria bacterium]|jgi:pyrroline-5-carboxylate reductase|nr:pyrroline-5-carboxylate reductase [Ignavibacteria bacterium]MCU7503900.1 pyrroline-5-carboxylate reductase [Ignavibacteria bacterium]MCU7515879.1 pyrroline-5-carboxylate reductase [Ignavibacteria bacterium]
MAEKRHTAAVLGGGNIGSAIANGLVKSGIFEAVEVTVTRRSKEHLKIFEDQGFSTALSNASAVSKSDVIIIAVTPRQLDGLLSEIKDSLDEKRHTVISVVSGASISDIRKKLENRSIPVLRAMPNTAIAIRESMTCICTDEAGKGGLELAKRIFESVGKVLVIDESLMVPATALCACGIAFFLRAIRAASQGGIEIGFHAEDALLMAAQTAKGAASLLVNLGSHPEKEVDKVTTPQGCTIAGLNQMEHNGFSSALIKGITSSAEKAAELYSK